MTHSGVRDTSYPISSMLISALKGTLVSIISVLALSLIFSAVSLSFADPVSVADMLSYAVLAISALVGGIFAMRFAGGTGLAVCAISGAAYVIVLWLLSLAFSAGAFSVLRLISYAVCILFSLLGGVLARKRRVSIKSGSKNPAALMRKRISAKK